MRALQNRGSLRRDYLTDKNAGHQKDLVLVPSNTFWNSSSQAPPERKEGWLKSSQLKFQFRYRYATFSGD